MKRSKFSEAQIAFVMKQAEDGTTIGEDLRHAYLATMSVPRDARARLYQLSRR